LCKDVLSLNIPKIKKMIQINLTPQETILLYGFLEGVLNKVNTTPDLELINKENTTLLLESIMGKVADELETKSNNN
jgi:hypothetical protein